MEQKKRRPRLLFTRESFLVSGRKTIEMYGTTVERRVQGRIYLNTGKLDGKSEESAPR
jgi:hypothetical protein